MKSRNITEVNAGSMADIAFLLLVFFLVTTTMNPDTGITVKLPAWIEGEVISEPISKRNTFSVLVNANNDLLVRGEKISVNELRQKLKNLLRILPLDRIWHPLPIRPSSFLEMIGVQSIRIMCWFTMS